MNRDRNAPPTRDDDRVPQSNPGGCDDERQFSPRGFGDDPARTRGRGEATPWRDDREDPRWRPGGGSQDPAPHGYREGEGSSFASYEDRGPTYHGPGFDDREAFQRAGRGDRSYANDRGLGVDRSYPNDRGVSQDLQRAFETQDYTAQGPRGGNLSAPASRGGMSGRGPMNYTRPDARIYEDVCDALTAHHEIDPSRVEVKVEGGEVTLTGAVDARAMKRRIEEVVEAVTGVKDVHNQIRVQREGVERAEGVAGASASQGTPPPSGTSAAGGTANAGGPRNGAGGRSSQA